MSKFGDELVYEAKCADGGVVQGWLGPVYPTASHPCRCGQDKEGWLYAPWAQRTMGNYSLAFKVTATFTGTPKLASEETAREVALKLAKRLEALPDWVYES